MKNALLLDLEQRGLIAQRSAEQELDEHLSQPRKVYSGFDPTADSLHIGNLMPLLTLRRFQLSGHFPILLLGGATGMIGDPSGRSAERNLSEQRVVDGWIERIRSQVERFVDFQGANAATIVNNLDWTRDLDVMTYLREVGKHFSVNAMIQRDSVKSRLEREGAGISYTEFSYMLLQANDFAELLQRQDCTIQIGGNDQWGNIVSGVDLIRRRFGSTAFALTMPLVTKADGTKFGKTADGAVWLDSVRTSPYAFYQFWLNTADADVYRYLKFFTFLSVEEIDALQVSDRVRSGKPEAQAVLARELTALVHGEEALRAAQRITQALFSGEVEELTEADLQQLQQDGLPTTHLPDDLAEMPLTTLLVDCGLAKSGKQVKDALTNRAVAVNNVPLGAEQNMATTEIFSPEHALCGRYFVVRLGKKNYHMFCA